MSDRIQILEAGTQVGIKINGNVNYFDRDSIEPYAEGHLVGIRKKDDIFDIVLRPYPTTSFINPKEASVKDLIQEIKLILDVVFDTGLSEDELKAITNSNSPSETNTFATIDDLVLGLQGRIVVNQSNVGDTLGGTIDSSKEYFIDGIVDLGNIIITVPSGGIEINGYSADLSQLISSENNYTMIFSSAGGNILKKNISISVTGTNSKVYDFTSLDGTQAVELLNVNYNNCNSLGELVDVRQYLEENTGRFGGTPDLTFSGTMNGIRVTTSIVRGIDNSWSGSLFCEGTTLTLSSRFISDINCDLGTLSSFCDFNNTVFQSSSLFQLKDCIFSRGGVVDPTDTNIIPNMSSSDLEAIWRTNQGIDNTYVGITGTLSVESLTSIAVVSTFYTLAGTWSESDQQHFSSPSNGQWKNDGVSPREFKIICYIVLGGGANDVYTVRLRKYDDSLGTTSTIVSQQSQVSNIIGGNDVTTFSILGKTTLDEDDYVFIEVANETDTSDCTAKIGSFITIEER